MCQRLSFAGPRFSSKTRDGFDKEIVDARGHKNGHYSSLLGFDAEGSIRSGVMGAGEGLSTGCFWLWSRRAKMMPCTQAGCLLLRMGPAISQSLDQL